MSSKFDTSIPFHNHKRRAKTPSFSSILLDAIYRSIDDDHHHHHHHHDHGYYPRTTPTSPVHSRIVKQRDRDDIHACRTKLRSDSTLETLDLRRAIMIESWTEKQPQKQQQNKHYFHLGDKVDDEKVRIIRQKSAPSRAPGQDDSLSSSCFLAQRSSSRQQSSSRIFTKTKSRAMKIYGELKKSKSNQNTPISPGRRIAAFLNSIFRNTSNSSTSSAKSSPENPPPQSMTTTSNSTCSTASSFSRSCLSNKTSSSSSKSTPATMKTKRSVRFYPVSVILDEDSRPCGHKSLHKDDENEGFKKLIWPRPVNGRGDEQKWRRDKEIDTLMMMIKANCGDNNARHHQVSRFEKCFDGQAMDEDEDEEDDNGSCGSSDLFELDNLSSIGVGDVSRYYEELPVYGTTSLKIITT